MVNWMSMATDTDIEKIYNSDNSNNSDKTGSLIEQFKGSNYQDAIDFLQGQMGKYKAETENEKRIRERRDRRRMAMANIADVLGGMHRSYSYQRGVSPMNLENYSEKTRERIEKAQAQRDRNRDHMMNYAITLGKLKDADRDFNLKATLSELQQKRYAAEQERKDALAEAQRGKYNAAANKDAAMTAYYEAKSNALLQGLPLDIAEKEAKIAKTKAETDRANRQGTPAWVSSGGGSGKAGEYPWYDKDGKINYAHSYEAMRQNAINNGTWNDETQQSVAVRKAGRKTTTTTTTKPAKGHSSKPKKYNNTSKLGL